MQQRPNKNVKLRPKSLSDPVKRMSSINYQNLFGYAIDKIHWEHPEKGKSYVGKIKIYLNDRELKLLL